MTKIFIDPGHGGTDPGAVGNGLREKDLTLKIATRIKELLAGYEDVQVKMSRTGDTFPSLKERTNAANAWGADFLLSVHINAGGGVGYEDFVYTSSSSASVAYQNTIHSEIMKQVDFKDRGKKKGNLHMVRESTMPALLTESGFIDNSGDAAKLKTAAFIEKLAVGHVNGIAKAFGLKRKEAAKVEKKNDYEGTDYEKVIEKAKKKGVMQGYPDGNFGVYDQLTRGQFVTVLDRLGFLD